MGQLKIYLSNSPIAVGNGNRCVLKSQQGHFWSNHNILIKWKRFFFDWETLEKCMVNPENLEILWLYFLNQVQVEFALKIFAACIIRAKLSNIYPFTNLREKGGKRHDLCKTERNSDSRLHNCSKGVGLANFSEYAITAIK